MMNKCTLLSICLAGFICFGCSITKPPQLSNPVLQAYKDAQEKSDFSDLPYAGYLAAIDKANTVEELMIIFPASVQTLPVDVFMSASGLTEIDRDHIREYRTKRIILKVELPEHESEHSIAAVHYKKNENDKPRCDLYLYEDGLWKEYVAIQDPDNIDDECKKMGIIIINGRLIDDSKFIKNLMSEKRKVR